MLRCRNLSRVANSILTFGCAWIPKRIQCLVRRFVKPFLFDPFPKFEKYLHELRFWQVFCLEMFLKLLGGATKHWSRPQHVMLGAHHVTHRFERPQSQKRHIYKHVPTFHFTSKSMSGQGNSPSSHQLMLSLPTLLTVTWSPGMSGFR